YWPIWPQSPRVWSKCAHRPCSWPARWCAAASCCCQRWRGWWHDAPHRLLTGTPPQRGKRRTDPARIVRASSSWDARLLNSPDWAAVLTWEGGELTNRRTLIKRGAAALISGAVLARVRAGENPVQPAATASPSPFADPDFGFTAQIALGRRVPPPARPPST